jgi:hemerythrin superfamily protein
MDVVSILENDHREIRNLLTRLRNASQNRLALFAELRELLEAHDSAEEERLYPAVWHVLNMKEEAETFLEEHQAARDLMARMTTVDPNGDAWRSLVADLSEIVETHIREEEELLCPQLRQLSPEHLGRIRAEWERAKGNLRVAC